MTSGYTRGMQVHRGLRRTASPYAMYTRGDRRRDETVYEQRVAAAIVPPRVYTALVSLHAAGHASRILCK